MDRDQHPFPLLPHPPPAPSRRRQFAVAWLQTWGLTTLGGGLCGMGSVGVATMVLFLWSIPTGIAAGAVFGLVASPILAAVFVWAPVVRTDPARFVRRIEQTGVAIAWTFSIPFNVWLVVACLVGLDDDPVVWATVAMVNAAIALFVTARIGVTWGHVLAIHHLRRLHRPEPPWPEFWPPMNLFPRDRSTGLWPDASAGASGYRSDGTWY
jgi:hypothetical protein